MAVDYEVFLISVILRAGCNEIKSNIVNCRMWLVDEKRKKKKVKIETQNERTVEIERDIWH